MDRIINTKLDKQTIYEIYRSCRLCGGGAGYKMPIVQSVIDLDTNGVELQQKIQECLQIEVHQDDKMPPLICELCVDKVNDFYDFMETCRQINKRTRLRLGLPLTTKRGAVSNASSDSGDCILGVTEPIFPEDNDNEPLSKSVKFKKTSREKSLKGKEKIKREKEIDVKVKQEKNVEPPHESRKVRTGIRREATPPRGRSTRASVGSVDDNVRLSSLKSSSKTSSAKSSPATPKSIMKKELKELNIVIEDDSPRTKRVRDKEPEKKPDVPPKKVKLATPTKTSKPKPKSKVPSPPTPPKPRRHPSPPKRPPTPPPTFPCKICGVQLKNTQGHSNHLRSHIVTFTSPRLACNPCGEWFTTTDECQSHHRRHKSKPYRCRHCNDSFRHTDDYDDHFEARNCRPFVELPDKQCSSCWRLYATQSLLSSHRCAGVDGRPGGKCNKCNRTYTLLKNLKKHEVTCTFKKKGEAIIDPEVERRLRDVQIRLARCDVLLNVKGERCDVSEVHADFGFDSSCVYPYRYRVKSEPTTGYDTMVTITDEIKDEYYARNYIHWDSDDTDDETGNIDSLVTITLKTIFSNKFLGKVPKKKRKVKEEKPFDNAEFDMGTDIDNIISNLDNDSANESDCSESIFGPFNKSNDSGSNINVMFNNLLIEAQGAGKNCGLANDCDEKSKVSNENDVNNGENNTSREDNDDCAVNNEGKSESREGNDDSVVDNEKNDGSRENNDVSKEDDDVAANDSSVIDGIEQRDVYSKMEGGETSQESRDKLSNEQISEKDINIENGVKDHSHSLQNNEKSDDHIENSLGSNDKSDAHIESSFESNDKNNDLLEGTVKFNGQVKRQSEESKEVSDSERDDNKLMDALDAQIGENNGDSELSVENNYKNRVSGENNDSYQCSVGNNDVNIKSVDNNDRLQSHENIKDANSEVNSDISERFNGKSQDNAGNNGRSVESNDFNSDLDKNKLDFAAKGQNNLKEMDLDCISDEEFNFDT